MHRAMQRLPRRVHRRLIRQLPVGGVLADPVEVEVRVLASASRVGSRDAAQRLTAHGPWSMSESGSDFLRRDARGEGINVIGAAHVAVVVADLVARSGPNGVDADPCAVFDEERDDPQATGSVVLEDQWDLDVPDVVGCEGAATEPEHRGIAISEFGRDRLPGHLP